MKNRGEHPINVAIIGGGYATNLLGAMDRAKGYDVRSIGYANRSGKHGVALGREDGEGRRREVDWGTAFTGPDIKENVKRLLNQKEKADVVLIALPPHLTQGVTEVVLDNSPTTTSVHIEKPVALDPNVAKDIYESRILGTDRWVEVGHQWVHNPPIELFAGYVQEKLGGGIKPEHVHAGWLGDTFFKGPKWWRRIDQSGGPLLEQGHPGHLAQHVLSELGELHVSDKIQPIAYYGIPDIPPGDVDMTKLGKNGLYVPTQIAAELEFANGTPMTLEASGIHRSPEVVDVTVAFPDDTVATFGKRGAKIMDRGQLIDEKTTEYPWPAFERQMQALLDAHNGVYEGTQVVNYLEGVAAVEIGHEVMDRLTVTDRYHPLFDSQGHRIRYSSATA